MKDKFLAKKPQKEINLIYDLIRKFNTLKDDPKLHSFDDIFISTSDNTDPKPGRWFASKDEIIAYYQMKDMFDARVDLDKYFKEIDGGYSDD